MIKSAAADDRLEKLEVLIGTWDTTITALDGGGEGAVSRAVDAYRWAPGGRYVLHDVDAMMEGHRVETLEIIALDPGGDGYAVRAYEADGTFADYQAERTGREWHISGTTLHFRGEFSEDGRRLWGQWDTLEDRQWHGLMRVSLVRRGG